MIDLLSISQVLLREAGFGVRLSSIQRSPIVCFEDNALIGFCACFDSPHQVISSWRNHEDEILARFAPSFRAAGDKAWNVYCVFLSTAPANAVETREIGWIEEDLERTRKISACGISSREDLIQVLLPVLPIQYQPVLLHENATERLKKRIRDIAPSTEQVALDPAISATEVVRLLGSRP
jgi:hypothetical protein